MKKFKSSRIFKSALAFVLAVCMFASTGAGTIQAEATSAQGIDVSNYQGAINWAAVAASGVGYAFIKVGSTNKGLDPYFAVNVRGAQAAGIRTGAYIYSYATSVAAATQEAQLMLQWIEGYNINYPVAIDIEDTCQKGLDANTVTAMANAFGDVISAAGYTPIIYTYTSFYSGHFTSALKYDKWIAHYSAACGTPGYAIWQYSSQGTVPGISAQVDMNVAVKDYSQFIIPAGPLAYNGNVYVFNNYRRQYGWAVVGGLKYLTDTTTGVAVTNNWYVDPAGTGTYYFGPTGAALTGAQTIGTDIYYFSADATLYKGWITLGNYTFYFDPNNNGKLYKGWYKDASGIKYLDANNGSLLTGPQSIEGSIYYFGADGYMQTGFITISGSKFYFGADGKMLTGWAQVGNGMYYFGADGRMVTGAQTIDGKIYYFNQEGVMQTGLVEVSGSKFYFGADGTMQKGWVSIGNSQYYFGTTGQMQYGLVQLADGIYGTSETDGHKYVNEVGKIAGYDFLFDSNGRLVQNGTYTIGKTVYATNENGVVTATAPATTATSTSKK